MICKEYPNFSSFGCLFSTRQNAQASFSEYIMFSFSEYRVYNVFRNVHELNIILWQERKSDLPFSLIKKVNFF